MYDLDEFMDAETMLEEADLAARRAVIAMDTQITMANLNGKSAAIRCVMEGAEDADSVAEAYFEASDKTANTEKKVGLIRKVLNKIRDLIDKIRNFIDEKIRRHQQSKVPDNKPCIIKRAWLKALEFFSNATKKIKAFCSKHKRGVIAVGAAAALGVIATLILKAKGIIGKGSGDVKTTGGVIKKFLGRIRKNSKELEEASEAIEQGTVANAQNDKDAKNLNIFQKTAKKIQENCHIGQALSTRFGNALTARKEKRAEKREERINKRVDKKYENPIKSGKLDGDVDDYDESYDDYDEYEDYMEDGDDFDALLADIDDDEYSESYDYDSELQDLFAEDYDEYDEYDEEFGDDDYTESYDDDEVDAASMLNTILSL